MNADLAIVLLTLNMAVGLAVSFWLVKRFWPPREEPSDVDESTLESLRKISMTRIP